MEKARGEIHHAGEKLVEQVEKTGKRIEEAAEKIPKRIIGDLHINFDDLCTKAKRHVCDPDKTEFCASEDQVGIEAFLGPRGDKVCCQKECSSTLPPIHARYLINYVGGNNLLTCAFQKGNDCKQDKYCQSEQWLKALDSKTCCKSDCIERVMQRDVFFDGLGYTSVERFPSNRFGIWYGSGVGDGFYDLGRPNYADTQHITDTTFQFSIEGKKYAFDLLQNEPSMIKVNATAVQ